MEFTRIFSKPAKKRFRNQSKSKKIWIITWFFLISKTHYSFKRVYKINKSSLPSKIPWWKDEICFPSKEWFFHRFTLRVRWSTFRFSSLSLRAATSPLQTGTASSWILKNWAAELGFSTPAESRQNHKTIQRHVDSKRVNFVAFFEAEDSMEISTKTCVQFSDRFIKMFKVRGGLLAYGWLWVLNLDWFAGF